MTTLILLVLSNLVIVYWVVQKDLRHQKKKAARLSYRTTWYKALKVSLAGMGLVVCYLFLVGDVKEAFITGFLGLFVGWIAVQIPVVEEQDLSQEE